MHSSCGFFALRIILTIGNEHCLQMSGVTTTPPPAGSLNVVLHSGYLLHAIKRPNFPVRSCNAPSLHVGQIPTVVIAAFVSLNVLRSSSPTCASLVLNSPSSSVNIPHASVNISG